MVHVEIELVGLADGTFGYIVHHYNVMESANGRIEDIQYIGEFECGGHCKDEVEAIEAARKRMDAEYGREGWQRI